MTTLERPDSPWIMRTYAGHSNARKSNELYRTNLQKGQTGLSIAFDLPTQTGYDSDHPRATGEVGKVGVPVSHTGDMDLLLQDIPLDQMNTSMTINATAMWLLSMYIVVAERQGVPIQQLKGTTQNDILKEFLARGTYIFPPLPSIKLTTDMFSYLIHRTPSWNPMNVCSYHLQEAGATPAQEIAFALANACQILDLLQADPAMDHETLEQIVGRFSFFVNAGIKFIKEISKMRAFSEMWDELTAVRYGIKSATYRRFRYGVQVNSLGLTAQQPENNVQRIVLEMLAVTLSRNVRARAVQLPAWNEALGLPRPWDQQWSLRLQQVLAYETDLLEYPDLFDGNPVMEQLTRDLKEEAGALLQRILDQGGAAANVDWMKTELVASHNARIRAIEKGDIKVVGVNIFTQAEPNPLLSDSDSSILTVAEEDVREQLQRLAQHRLSRNSSAVADALRNLKDTATAGGNLMQASIAAATVGVTTGEWSDILRGVFGEFQGPTGIEIGVRHDQLDSALRDRVKVIGLEAGRPLRMLVGKPGLDGHSNGAEQIAVRARDLGFEVIYEGIRLTPARLVDSAISEGVHVIGLSILSGSHREILPQVIAGFAESGVRPPLMIAGGIIPPADAEWLKLNGFDAVFTPEDFDLNLIFSQILDLLEARLCVR